jgi:glycine/D-amino acid oxidase-like deaminating enzyme/nitrite reductase/ring-hydroxylating ferredoxin subunit
MTSLWMDTVALPETHEWQDGAHHDVVVVGAGLTGLATAYLLARRGVGVTVLEARTVGAVTTGGTTGKVSLLQGTALSRIRELAGEDAARTYVRANRAGQEWLLEELGEGDTLQRRDAWTYAVTDAGRRRAAQEWHACAAAGLPVKAVDPGSTGLPFRTVAALRLEGQAQVHAGRMLDLLLRRVLDAGGTVVEGVRVTGVDGRLPGAVQTDHGTVHADRVILATGTPFLDRGLHFALLAPGRSYGSAYEVPGPVPAGMYLSADTPTRSLRTAPVEGRELLVVGGNGHPVGRPDERGMTPRALVEELDGWTMEHFPGARRTHLWSAQDYTSPDGIPYVGPVHGSEDRILLATGFNKWGMTNGAAAALALAGKVVGQTPPWADLLAGRGAGVSRARSIAKLNAQVAGRLATGLVGAESVPAPDTVPEGCGVVGRDGVRPVSVSTVGGVTRRVAGRCTHLGGILEWNDSELTWDCPLHGSRFGPDGTVLEGPATRDLEAR